MENSTWIEKLQKRWRVGSTSKVLIILAVFACTGLTVMFIKPVLTSWFFKSGHSTWFSILYWILILPLYNALLLLYGFVLGNFRFFWDFEKRFLKRMMKPFRRKR